MKMGLDKDSHVEAWAPLVKGRGTVDNPVIMEITEKNSIRFLHGLCFAGIFRAVSR